MIEALNEKPDFVWRLGLLGLLAAFGLLFVSGVEIWGADFGPLWAAGRAALHEPDRIYDFDFITRAQPWLFGSLDKPTLRPFAYPPTALLFLGPLALAPFGVAWALWTLATGAAFFVLAIRAGAPRWFVLFTAVIHTASAGQATFLVGALLLGAFISRNRVLAGVLFGLAACIKPQAVLLIPVALIATRDWRALFASAATSGLLTGASVALWGLDCWLAWLRAVAQFAAIVTAPDFANALITPFGALVRLGMDGHAALLMIVPATALVWLVFRRTHDPLYRLLALAGGGLLIGSYAVRYELALLAPTVARESSSTKLATSIALVFAMAFWAAGLLALVAALLLVIPMLRSRPSLSEQKLALCNRGER